MSDELLPSALDRPAFVTDADGWKVYVHVHDTGYLRELARFKAQLVAQHPDATGGRDGAFKETTIRRRAWHAREVAWYGQYDLTVPGSPTSGTAHGSHTGALPQRLVEALADGRPHARRDLEAAYGFRLHADQITQAMTRLRLRGTDIERRPDGAYQLVTRGRPKQGDSVVERLHVVLADGQRHTLQALEAAVEGTATAVMTAISRLRERGVPIVTVRHGHGTITYALDLTEAPA
jgi:biotin operon repressor